MTGLMGTRIPSMLRELNNSVMRESRNCRMYCTVYSTCTLLVFFYYMWCFAHVRMRKYFLMKKRNTE